MEEPLSHDRKIARSATGDELARLVHSPDVETLLALVANPALDETHLCLMLERKNLPSEVLESVARRKALTKSYRVKRALAFHARSPRLVGLRLLRDLYLMDLVQLTFLPGISVELKLNAEEQLVARLPQLPLRRRRARRNNRECSWSPALVIPASSTPGRPTIWGFSWWTGSRRVTPSV